jgi:hypothetical protein
LLSLLPTPWISLSASWSTESLLALYVLNESNCYAYQYQFMHIYIFFF